MPMWTLELYAARYRVEDAEHVARMTQLEQGKPKGRRR